MKRRLTLLALAASGLAATASVQAQSPVLIGQWTSAATENNGTHFASRRFVFTDTHWSVVYRAFADAQARQPLFTLQVAGTYLVGGPSRAVSGAYEGIFPANMRQLTADSEGGVQMFAAMGCKLEVGKPTTLVSEGCGFVPGTMQAMGEYDLIAVRDGRVYFGDRSADLTKARPDRLTAYPLVKQ